MKLRSTSEIEGFTKTVDECHGEVWLESPDVKLNLKSKMSQYVAIGELIRAEGNNLELYCSLPEDEARFFAFFGTNSDVI